MAELHRAVAVAEAKGPVAGPALAESAGIPDSRSPDATRAELLARPGRTANARAADARALRRVRPDAERRHLGRRLAELA